jgi:membrane protein implicated in regulation of membrane protease activity
MSLIVFQVAQSPIFGFVGWFLPPDVSWKAVVFVLAIALVAFLAFARRVSRARADRRWRTALDRYAQQEQAKRTHSFSRYGKRRPT